MNNNLNVSDALNAILDKIIILDSIVEKISKLEDCYSGLSRDVRSLKKDVKVIKKDMSDMKFDLNEALEDCSRNSKALSYHEKSRHSSGIM